MTEPLVSNADQDLALWQAGDQATFLNMVCAEVRKYCGWHIAPSVLVSNKVFWFGERGLIMLGSTHVTDVGQVSIEGQVLTAGVDYLWQEPKGWLRLNPRSLAVPSTQPWIEPSATVTFTHGYDETPLDVKAVIFEIVATAMELPASNATEFTTTQYAMKLNSDIGVMLSKDQKERLNGYKVNKFGGRVQP